jgi:hypothetical protein
VTATWPSDVHVSIGRIEYVPEPGKMRLPDPAETGAGMMVAPWESPCLLMSNSWLHVGPEGPEATTSLG